MKLGKLVEDIINEEILKVPEIPNTTNFWHGGNLDEYNDNIAQKNGRYEYGPGLYLITHYDTAKKYAKGSRKLYLVSVENGNELNKSFLDINNIKEFIKSYVLGSKRKEVFERISKYNNDGKVKAYLFNNIILNEKAINPTNTKNLREFYINNNIDYELISNPFGWGETMMVLYNMKKIKNIITIKPTDKINNYDL